MPAALRVAARSARGNGRGESRRSPRGRTPSGLELRFRLARPAGSAAGADSRPVASSRVLVVDDEPAIRLLCRVNLPFAGFEVVEASTGDEALERLRDEQFDLVLLDVMMPGLSGFDVAEALREDPELAKTPIVFLSARADEADVRRGLDLGAADYITKPFDPLTIGPRLTALLERDA